MCKQTPYQTKNPCRIPSISNQLTRERLKTVTDYKKKNEKTNVAWTESIKALKALSLLKCFQLFDFPRKRNWKTNYILRSFSFFRLYILDWVESSRRYTSYRVIRQTNINHLTYAHMKFFSQLKCSNMLVSVVQMCAFKQFGSTMRTMCVSCWWERRMASMKI